MKSRFLLSFLVVFCFFVVSTYAQVPISVGGLEISASTDNPTPGQTVTLTARSYVIDINSSKISWAVDGITQSGTGMTTLDVKAPSLGKKIVVSVTATTPEGRVVRSSITISSGSIDIIIETDGYVPPLFRGKVPPVYQNTVKIIAMPHIANASGVEYDPKTLVYQWKRNDRVLEDQSGYGKQFITLVGDIVPREYDLDLIVWSRDNSARAETLAQISVGGPSTNFYIDDPLYGPLFNRAIDSILRIGVEKEVGALAVPFGFNKAGGGLGSLSYSWLVNGIQRPELSSHESIVLRSPNDSSGDSSIQLDIKNTDKILQGASGQFSVSFSQKKSDVDTVSF